MKLATPRWWYVRDRIPAPMTRMLLTPLSWAWAAVTANTAKLRKTPLMLVI